MPWEKRAIFQIFRRIFRFFIVLFIPFFNREDCQGALRCATKGDRFYLAVPKLGICSKIGAAGESPTSTQPHYVGDWSYFGTNFGNPIATSVIGHILERILETRMRPIGSSGLAILESLVAQSDGFF